MNLRLSNVGSLNIQGDLEWLRKSLNLLLIPECPIWAVKYVIFSVKLGHLNIMFPKITIWNYKNIRRGRKLTSKMKSTWKCSKFKLKKICLSAQFLTPFILRLETTYFKPNILPKKKMYQLWIKKKL